MNARIYQSVCMFCLVLVQFVYPPQSNAQSSVRSPLVTTTPWQKQEDLVESRLPGKLAAEMRRTVGSLSSWAQQAGVDSLGCTAAWCGAYFSSKTNPLPLFRYEMRAGFFTGQPGAINAEPGKDSRLTISVNDLSVLQQTFPINGNDYLSLPPMEQVYDGVQYYQSTWLITRVGHLPFSILSRKEYLEEAKKEVAADKQRLKEDLQQKIPVKTARQEELANQREIDAIGNMYSGATRDSRVRSYLAAYKPDSVYFKEVFAGQSASLDADSLLLDDMLKNASPDSLAKPAFVSVPAHDFRNFEDGQPGSRMLAKWDLTYFDKSFSLAKPQFIVVSWQYDPGDPVAIKIGKLISGLDYCQLYNYL